MGGKASKNNGGSKKEQLVSDHEYTQEFAKEKSTHFDSRKAVVTHADGDKSRIRIRQCDSAFYVDNVNFPASYGKIDLTKITRVEFHKNTEGRTFWLNFYTQGAKDGVEDMLPLTGILINASSKIHIKIVKDVRSSRIDIELKAIKGDSEYSCRLRQAFLDKEGFPKGSESQQEHWEDCTKKLLSWRHQGASDDFAVTIEEEFLGTVKINAIEPDNFDELPQEEHKEQSEINSGASSTSGTEPDTNPEGANTDSSESDADPAPTAKKPTAHDRIMARLGKTKDDLGKFASLMKSKAPPAPKEATKTRRLAADDPMENVFTMMWILPLLVIFVFWFKRYIVTKNNDDIVEDYVEDENDLSNIV
jgi:hypothetical protein